LLLGDPSTFINLWGDVYAIKTCSLVESQPLKKSYQTSEACYPNDPGGRHGRAGHLTGGGVLNMDYCK
jgi:hypothetical protein